MTHPDPVQTTHQHCQASESPAPRIVRWLDSSLQNGQVDRDDFPVPVIITSVGFVVEETDEHITLARDDMGHDGDYRGLCSIPQCAVLAVRISAIGHAATRPASSTFAAPFCPRNKAHGPHDWRARFCFVCGKRLVNAIPDHERDNQGSPHGF